MISARYAWPLAVLLLVALVPTVRNVYRTPEPHAPGTLAAEMPANLEGCGKVEPGKHTESWVQEIFGTADFVSRSYESKKIGGSLSLFAARSYDGKRLFHFPELALTYGRPATGRSIEEIDTEHGTLPVHVIEFKETNGSHQAVYALLYGSTGVRGPIRFMLGRVPELFAGHKEAMTLVYVQGSADSTKKSALASELRTLIAAACAGYLK
ncbi:MAG: hypothetical protein ACYTGZ_03250 [Planctomycetota bacterium]